MVNTRSKKSAPKSKYPKAKLKSVLKEVGQGNAVSNAAKKWKVPKPTLKSRAKPVVKVKPVKPVKPVKSAASKKSFQGVLTKLEEQFIGQWVIDSCNAGFYITEDQVLNSIQHLITELERQTSFPYNRPSKKWFYSFLQRHEDIAQRVHRTFAGSQESLSRERIQSWFEGITNYLFSLNCLDVLNDPERVFNADEVGFFVNPKDGRSLFKRGAEGLYRFINIDQRECLVVFLTVSASGKLPPPMIVLQNSGSLHFLQKSVPDGWKFGISENGWMTWKTFFDYVVYVFKPWLDENNILKPVALFFNGHTTHITLQLSRFCIANGIILIGLLPNSSHVLQPLDVAVFSTLEEKWLLYAKQTREKTNAAILKISEFCSSLEDVIKNSISPALIQSGFKRCGLLPWDPSALDYDKLLRDLDWGAINENTNVRASPSQENGSIDPTYRMVLKVIEREMGGDRVKLFYSLRNHENWTGLVHTKDIGLFKVWKDIVSKAEKGQAVANEDYIPEHFCEVVIKETSEET